MTNKIYIITLLIIHPIMSMQQPDMPPKRWKEIAINTLLGKLPTELQEELGKYQWSDFLKELEVRLNDFYYALFTQDERISELIRSIARWQFFIKKYESDPNKKNYAFNKLYQKLNGFLNDKLFLEFLSLNTTRYLLSNLIEIMAKDRLLTLFDAYLKREALSLHFFDAILKSGRLTDQDIKRFLATNPTNTERDIFIRKALNEKLQEMAKFKV